MGILILMKNIAVLPVLVIMLLFSAVKPVYTQEYSFSFGPLAGFVYGEAFEYVYPVYEPAELLSELIWDMKPVFYLGSKFDFGLANLMSGAGFFASLAFKAGIPMDSGKNENRDWTSLYHTNLTHYSEHTNKTTQFFWLDLSAGASIPIADIFYIKPFLTFSWMHFSFSGRDGFRRYAFENWAYHPFYGEVITYQQDWLLAGPGVSIGAYIGSFLQLEISFKYTPFTYCEAVDHHKDESKIMVYNDYTGWGHFIEPSGSLSFKFKKADLTLEFAYRQIGRTTGVSYSNENNKGYYLSNNKSGAALSLIDTRIIFKIIL